MGVGSNFTFHFISISSFPILLKVGPWWMHRGRTMKQTVFAFFLGLQRVSTGSLFGQERTWSDEARFLQKASCRPRLWKYISACILRVLLALKRLASRRQTLREHGKPFLHTQIAWSVLCIGLTLLLSSFICLSDTRDAMTELWKHEPLGD